MRRKAAALAALLAIALSFGMSTASASQLVVTTGNQITAQSLYKCNETSAVGAVSLGATTESAAGNKNQITITNIPSACQGALKAITVDVYEGSLRRVGTPQSGATASSVTVTVPNYTPSNVTAVIVKIDGWLFPATWSYTPADNGRPPVGTCATYLYSTGAVFTKPSCTLSVELIQGPEFVGPGNGGPGYDAYYRITSDLSEDGENVVVNGNYTWYSYQSNAQWRATVNLVDLVAGTPIDLTGDYYIYRSNYIALAQGEDCSNPRAVTFVEGSPEGNSEQGTFIVSDTLVNWIPSSQLLCKYVP